MLGWRDLDVPYQEQEAVDQKTGLKPLKQHFEKFCSLKRKLYGL